LWARTRAGGRIEPPPYERLRGGGGARGCAISEAFGRDSLLWRPALYGGGAAPPPPAGGGSNGGPPPQGGMTSIFRRADVVP
jgi:hypothetical protein